MMDVDELCDVLKPFYYFEEFFEKNNND